MTYVHNVSSTFEWYISSVHMVSALCENVKAGGLLVIFALDLLMLHLGV